MNNINKKVVAYPTQKFHSIPTVTIADSENRQLFIMAKKDTLYDPSGTTCDFFIGSVYDQVNYKGYLILHFNPDKTVDIEKSIEGISINDMRMNDYPWIKPLLVAWIEQHPNNLFSE